jgi:hypothetical protein
MKKSIEHKGIRYAIGLSHHWGCHWRTGGYIIFLGCETGIFSRSIPMKGRSLELTFFNFSITAEYMVMK